MPPDSPCPDRAWLEERLEMAKLLVHDFKNPISAVFANLSYLTASAEDLPGDMAASFADSTRALRILLNMMDGFLTLARLEASTPVSMGAASLSEFLHGSAARCAGLLGDDGVPISVGKEVPDALCQWEMEFASAALDNLVMTSAMNSPQGTEVRIEATSKPDSVVISVLDSGNPISSEHRDAIFDRSFQVKAKNLNGARYGKVMGLYTVKLAAQRLGGTVHAESRDAKNAFVLELPWIQTTAPQAPLTR